MGGEERINIKLPNPLHLSFSISTAALSHSDELLSCQTRDHDGRFPQPHGHCCLGEVSVGSTLPSSRAWASGSSTGQGQCMRRSPGRSKVREKFHCWLQRAGFHSWNYTSGTGETAWVVFVRHFAWWLKSFCQYQAGTTLGAPSRRGRSAHRHGDGFGH